MAAHKNNPELPVALYEEVALTSANDLNEVIQVSKIGTGERLQQGIVTLLGTTETRA